MAEETFRALNKAKKDLQTLYEHVDGVQGFGIGQERLHIYVQNAEISPLLPSAFAGYDVDVIIVGDITAQ